MTGRPANQDMVDGYIDGFDPTTPKPSGNRSRSYRHGFANGRADRCGKPSDTYANLCQAAELAMKMDEQT